MTPKQDYIPAQQVKRARSLRQDSPIPERILWGILRNRQLGGLKFRRQHPVGPYIVDYYCDEANLVVELDGMSHVGQGAKDDKRTRYIEQEGMRVYRVTNDDLLQHREAVAEDIARAAGLDW